MKRTALLLAVLAPLALIQPGCSEIRGCTDPFSDNYDPEATADDDTCVPTRQKFVGEYEAYGIVTDNVQDGNGDWVKEQQWFEQIALVVEDQTAVDQETLIAGLSNFDLPLYALTLKVTGMFDLDVVSQSLGAFTFSGKGNINGRVIELKYRRIEKVEVEPEVFVNDTIWLDLYGVQKIVE